MIPYSDTVTDEVGVAIPGVQVVVRNTDASLAQIYTLAGAAIVQPGLVTDSAGYFAFQTNDGDYDIEYRLDGILVRRDRVPLGAAEIGLTKELIIGALEFTPVQQGTGVGQSPNVVKAGWSPSRLAVKLTVDATDIGEIVVDQIKAARDGVTDDRARLVAVDADLPLILTRGRYLVASSVTFTKPVTFQPGSVLVIPNGVTVTFTAGIEAGDYRIFDLASTGAVAGLSSANLDWFAYHLAGTSTAANAMIQKAVDALLDFGVLHVPARSFALSGTAPITVTRGQSIKGVSKVGTRFLFLGAACNGFSFSGGSGGVVEDIGFDVYSRGILPTSGTAINITASVMTFSRIQTTRAYNGIFLTGCVGHKMYDLELNGCLNTGLWGDNFNDVFVDGFLISAVVSYITPGSVTGTPISGEAVVGNTSGATGNLGGIGGGLYDVFVNVKNFTIGETVTCQSSSATFVVSAQAIPHQLGGIRLTNKAEAFIALNGDVIGGKFAMTTDAVTYGQGTRPAYNRFTNVYFDSADEGCLISRAIEFDWNSCWWSNRPGSGALFTQCDGHRFNGSSALNCHLHGVDVDGNCTNFAFLGGAYRGNSRAASGTYSGIYFRAGASKFTVQGVCFDDTGLSMGTQKNGVEVVAGASDRYSIVYNRTPASGIVDGGTGTNKSITGNF